MPWVFTILKLFFTTVSTKMDKISSAEPDKVSSALSFSVEFEDEPKKAKRKPPKHLLDRHNKRKEVSQESIDEKQRKADDRRKVVQCVCL